MSAPLIIVALRPLPADALEALAGCGEVVAPEGQLSAEGALALLADADALLISPFDRLTAAMIAAAPRLKHVSSISAGLDHIDLAACRARGIAVANAPDATTEPTADLAFALILAAARRLPDADRMVRAGEWERTREPFWGLDVHHRTLGIIGLGRIGQAVARRAAGFSMRVIYHNRRPIAADAAASLLPAPEWRSLHDLMAESDVVLVQAPLTPETRGMVGAREIALMKPGAILVNTGRGGLVDEDALADALTAGAIAGAALDVFDGEPKVNPRLLAAPNLVLAPHIGTATRASRHEMLMLAIANLRRMLAEPAA